MKKKFLYNAILLYFGLSLFAFGKAQVKTSVKASIDKNSILIGERINLVLQANIPENEPIRFFAIDTIPHFEILDKSKTDTLNTSNGTELKQTLRLTSFDSGQWVIPSFSFASSEEPLTDSFSINVGFTPLDSTKDYNDIKNIIPVDYKEKEDYTWYYVGGGILLLLLLIYLLARKKKKTKVAPVVLEDDPFTAALKQLDQLQKQNLPAKGEIKSYYSRLTDIFRVYVEKRIGIQSQQKTTEDLVVQLRVSKLNKEELSQLSQALRLSDFVKFAKYVPGDSDNKTIFDIVKKSIQDIEKTIPPATSENEKPS
jgi:LPXTG-motif cell wall-anchored protein